MAVKKYQIFISSTFADLQEERQLATKAILDLDHIPAGMEAFPAVDMEQFEYIKKVIDECDYYLLIVAARYGSVNRDGISYTELEYDYAVSTKKTVIALIHNDIESLPIGKSDKDPDRLARLKLFREKVTRGRMVRMWSTRDQLIAGLMQAISRAITTFPAAGWVRGDTPASEELLQQNFRLRAACDTLQAELDGLRAANTPKLDGLAELGDEFLLRHRYMGVRGGMVSDQLKLTWGQIFKTVGSDMISPARVAMIEDSLKGYIGDENREKTAISINNEDLNTVKMHLNALGLIDVYAGKAGNGITFEYVVLTERGRVELLRISAVRKATASDSEGDAS